MHQMTCVRNQGVTYPALELISHPAEIADQQQSRILVESKTSVSIENGTVFCPDRNTTCPNGSSCCKVPFRYECHPIYNAACCSDGEHCYGSRSDADKCITQSVPGQRKRNTSPIILRNIISMNHFFFLNDFCVMFMCPICKSVGQRKLHLVVNQGWEQRNLVCAMCKCNSPCTLLP